MKSRNKNIREQNFQVGVWITSSILLLVVLWIGTGFIFTDISSMALTPKLCYPDQVHEENLAK
jgi:hypothetical protein